MAIRARLRPTALGALALIVTVLPVVAVIAMLISDRFATAAMITLIISIGLQLPLRMIFCELAGDRVPPSERSMFKGFWSVRRPFTLIEFRWRYLR